MDFWGEFSKLIAELIDELAVHSIIPPGVPITPTSPLIALTNYLIWLGVAFLTTAIFFAIASRKISLVPKGVANLAEFGVEFVRDSIVTDTLGAAGVKYFPFVGTLFFFILFCNLWGLFGVPVPWPVGTAGGLHLLPIQEWRILMAKPATGDISITATWALIVFFYFWYEGIRKNGVIKYLGSFAPGGAPPGIKQMVWVLEFVLMFMRPVTLAVRLFANMYAGHLVLGVFSIFALLGGQMMIELVKGNMASGLGGGLIFILSLLLLVALYAFELFVALIQAYVFSMLTVQYINLSIHTDH